MSRQEAIRHLKAARLMLLAQNGQPISGLYDALSIAIEALEKEEYRSLYEMSNLPVVYNNCANIYSANDKNHSENPNS